MSTMLIVFLFVRCGSGPYHPVDMGKATPDTRDRLMVATSLTYSAADCERPGGMGIGVWLN